MDYNVYRKIQLSKKDFFKPSINLNVDSFFKASFLPSCSFSSEKEHEGKKVDKQFFIENAAILFEKDKLHLLELIDLYEDKADVDLNYLRNVIILENTSLEKDENYFYDKIKYHFYFNLDKNLK